jgi:S1-C subfamily serine protease
MAGRVVDALARAPVPPAWVKVDAPTSSGRGGYGAYFGVVPDFGGGEGPPRGVRITGVRPGSPAEKAGMQGGDVIVHFAGVEVRTLEYLRWGLGAGGRGDLVLVVVHGSDGEHRVQAVLEERR